MKRIVQLMLAVAFFAACGYSQTTIFFQGFENASLTCTENWGYTGGVRNSENNRTGSFAARVGRSAESNTLTFNTVNISGLSGVNLQIYHSVRGGTGPGMDTREGAAILVSLNGAAFTPLGGGQGQVSGFGDYNYSYATNPANAGSASAGCTLFTSPNPINYSVPAGTNTIAIKVVSVAAGSCATFNTNMGSGTAANYDRADEGFFIDDVRLTTTSTAIPGIWTGAFNTDWFDCRNWNNNIVPTATTNVTIDQTAVNNCVVGFSGSGNAVCNNISVSSNNGTNNTLTVQNIASLNCGGNMTITKSGGSGNQKLTLLNSATFSCNNLTLTGNSSGAENAQFENEISTSVSATINGNLLNNSGGKLDLSNPPNYGIIHIKGNYTNNGLETDFKQSNSIVHFDGTGNQTINAASFTEIFSNIVINKSSGNLTLNTPVDIEQSVTYTQGILYTSLTNLVNFYDNATASGMSNSSFTDGPVRKTGNDAFTFPVGDITNYQAATISAPSNTSHHFTAQYFQLNPDPTYDENLKDPTLDHISNCEYWIIDRTNGSSNVTVTLTWDANSCGVTNLSDLRVARWDLTMWKDHGNGGTTGTTAAGTIITSAPVTSFSPFTLASATSENPLPVELFDFSVTCENGNVNANWTSASEINNHYFELQGSIDAFTYEPVKTIPGSGNSNQVINYNTEIINTSRYTYFRLLQVDYNGSAYYYSPVYLECAPTHSSLIAINNENGIELVLPSGISDQLSIEVMEMSGKTMLVQPVYKTSTNLVDLPIPYPLPAGIYIIGLTDQLLGNKYYTRFLVNK
jgi:hypothetical protein